jgi:hypothetical protein
LIPVISPGISDAGGGDTQGGFLGAVSWVKNMWNSAFFGDFTPNQAICDGTDLGSAACTDEIGICLWDSSRTNGDGLFESMGFSPSENFETWGSYLLPYFPVALTDAQLFAEHLYTPPLRAESVPTGINPLTLLYGNAEGDFGASLFNDHLSVAVSVPSVATIAKKLGAFIQTIIDCKAAASAVTLLPEQFRVAWELWQPDFILQQVDPAAQSFTTGPPIGHGVDFGWASMLFMADPDTTYDSDATRTVFGFAGATKRFTENAYTYANSWMNQGVWNGIPETRVSEHKRSWLFELLGDLFGTDHRTFDSSAAWREEYSNTGVTCVDDPPYTMMDTCEFAIANYGCDFQDDGYTLGIRNSQGIPGTVSSACLLSCDTCPPHSTAHSGSYSTAHSGSYSTAHWHPHRRPHRRTHGHPHNFSYTHAYYPRLRQRLPQLRHFFHRMHFLGHQRVHLRVLGRLRLCGSSQHFLRGHSGSYSAAHAGSYSTAHCEPHNSPADNRADKCADKRADEKPNPVRDTSLLLEQLGER